MNIILMIKSKLSSISRHRKHYKTESQNISFISIFINSTQNRIHIVFAYDIKHIIKYEHNLPKKTCVSKTQPKKKFGIFFLKMPLNLGALLHISHTDKSVFLCEITIFKKRTGNQNHIHTNQLSDGVCSNYVSLGMNNFFLAILTHLC